SRPGAAYAAGVGWFLDPAVGQARELDHLRLGRRRSADRQVGEHREHVAVPGEERFLGVLVRGGVVDAPIPAAGAQTWDGGVAERRGGEPEEARQEGGSGGIQVRDEVSVLRGSDVAAVGSLWSERDLAEDLREVGLRRDLTRAWRRRDGRGDAERCRGRDDDRYPSLQDEALRELVGNAAGSYCVAERRAPRCLGARGVRRAGARGR